MSILIKKYNNRRLYDTDKSVYITFEDLQQYVLQGIAFNVVEVDTGKDLTNTTLLQILLEMENASTQFLSSEVLRHLIILANHPVQQSMNQLMEHFFASLQNAEANPWVQGMQDWKQWMEKWQNSFKNKP